MLENEQRQPITKYFTRQDYEYLTSSSENICIIVTDITPNRYLKVGDYVILHDGTKYVLTQKQAFGQSTSISRPLIKLTLRPLHKKS